VLEWYDRRRAYIKQHLVQTKKKSISAYEIFMHFAVGFKTKAIQMEIIFVLCLCYKI